MQRLVSVVVGPERGDDGLRPDRTELECRSAGRGQAGGHPADNCHRIPSPADRAHRVITSGRDRGVITTASPRFRVVLLSRYRQSVGRHLRQVYAPQQTGAGLSIPPARPAAAATARLRYAALCGVARIRWPPSGLPRTSGVQSIIARIVSHSRPAPSVRPCTRMAT
jgi:hypothetical protein